MDPPVKSAMWPLHVVPFLGPRRGPDLSGAEAAPRDWTGLNLPSRKSGPTKAASLSGHHLRGAFISYHLSSSSNDHPPRPFDPFSWFGRPRVPFQLFRPPPRPFDPFFWGGGGVWKPHRLGGAEVLLCQHYSDHQMIRSCECLELLGLAAWLESPP